MGIVRSYMLVISGSQRVKLNIMGLLEVERGRSSENYYVLKHFVNHIMRKKFAWSDTIKKQSHSLKGNLLFLLK